MRTNDLLNLVQQPPKTISKDGAHYGTPYRHGETPLGENLEPGKIPTSIRKSFRRHPDIEALSLLPDADTYVRMANDIAVNGIQVPLILWRTTRETTDERIITEYIVVDGYLRLRIAEELKVPMESIPWIVNEDIQSLEQAILTATRLKMYRSHYNECERKYMIGLRYLQEKKRVGAPDGSRNAALEFDQEDDLDGFENETENNAVNLTTLNSGDDQQSTRTCEIIANELQMGEKTIRRYAKTAQNIELAAEEIMRRWKVSKAVAVRCCTQLMIQKRDKNGEPTDARLITAGDWAKARIQAGCLDPYPLKVVIDPLKIPEQKIAEQKKLSHYHDERLEAITAAVREVITPVKAYSYINVEFSEIEVKDGDGNKVSLPAHIAKIEDDEKRYRRMSLEVPREICMRFPGWVEYHNRKRNEIIAELEATALTHPDKERRLEALRRLASEGLPLPTDELDERSLERIRRTMDPKYHRRPSAIHLLREQCPLEPEWENYADLAQNWDHAIRQYQQALHALSNATEALVAESRVMQQKYDRGDIDVLSTWQGPAAKKIKEIFLEMAKMLSDTNANHPYLVVGRDPGIHSRIKAGVIEIYDTFDDVGADVAGEISISTRYLTHKRQAQKSTEN